MRAIGGRLRRTRPYLAILRRVRIERIARARRTSSKYFTISAGNCDHRAIGHYSRCRPRGEGAHSAGELLLIALSGTPPGIHLEIVVRESRGAQAEAFLKDLRSITEGSWNDEELAQAEERYRRSAAVINRIRAGLSRDNAADRSWLEQCLDTRTHVSFIAREIDTAGDIRTVHASDRGLSGGQKQKLVIFCLAAALRYQLAEDGADIPSFGTVTMDEAFDKNRYGICRNRDEHLRGFRLQLVLATPGKMVQVAENHVGSIVCFHCHDGKQTSTTSIVAEKDDCPDDQNQEQGL